MIKAATRFPPRAAFSTSDQSIYSCLCVIPEATPSAQEITEVQQ